jgi:hypothetical protein
MINNFLNQLLNELIRKSQDASYQRRICKTDRQYFWLGKFEAYNEIIVIIKNFLKRNSVGN